MLQSEAHNNLTDEDLLDRYRQDGDTRWLGWLLQRYTMLLFGVAFKYLKDRDQAQDAVQQVFLKALTHLPEGEIRNFKGWLYILVRNHCFQLLRDKTRLAPEEAMQHIPAAEDAGDEHWWKDYTLEQMHQGLAELGYEQRMSLELFYLKKLSYQQIMEQTGFSFMQVKSFIQNGKRNLKQTLIRKLGSRKR